MMISISSSQTQTRLRLTKTSKILIFNPSNDMALAANSLSYLPPRNIMQMESDLALLPLWWAEEGDYILCISSSSISQSVLYRVLENRTISPVQKDSDGTYSSLLSITHESLSVTHDSLPLIQPWGWSLSLRHSLLRLGASSVPNEEPYLVPNPKSCTAPNLLPSEEALFTYRSLSSRAFACDYIHRFLLEADSEGWGTDLVGRGMHIIDSFIPSDYVDSKGFPLSPSSSIYPAQNRPDGSPHIGGDARRAERVFKTLWSSSGRGVFTCLLDAPLDVNRVLGSIRHQGSILVDDFYGEKFLDFALEFQIAPQISTSSDIATKSAAAVPEASASGLASKLAATAPAASASGLASFLGFSVFTASTSGSYGYNLVESQASLRNRILDTGISSTLLDLVVSKTASLLSSFLSGKYSGPVGVDMLVCHHQGKVMLHPCIEINLRRNMGILAIDIYNRLGENASAVLAGNPEHGFCARVENGRLFIDFQK